MNIKGKAGKTSEQNPSLYKTVLSTPPGGMVAPSYIDYLLNRWLIGWDSFKEFNSKIIGFSVTMIDTPHMDQI